jgi:hypothetical protein
MRRFALLLGVVLLVAGVWSAVWLLGAGAIKRSVAEFSDNDGVNAPKLTCGRLDVTGFPFRFDVECANATIVSGDQTTTVAGMKATFLVYNPTQAKLSALAPVTMTDAFSGARSRIDFTAAEGSARLTPADLWRGVTSGAGWRIARISIVANRVEWTDTVLDERLAFSAGHLDLQILDAPEQHDPERGTATLATFTTLEDVAAPDLGVAGGEVELQAELTGLPDDIRNFGAPDATRAWQAAGGQLKLVSLKGTAGEQFIESDGTLALDSGFRLDGQVNLRSKGLVERIGPMLPEEWKGLIVGDQDADGSYSQTVTIKAGIVFSGLIPISVIPPLL